MRRDWRPQTQAVRVLTDRGERTAFLHDGMWWIVVGINDTGQSIAPIALLPVALEGEL